MTPDDKQIRDALAPCPFCGGHAYYNHTDAGPDRKYYRVHCEKCDARIGHPYTGKDAAREAWNTRAALTQKPAGGDAAEWIKAQPAGVDDRKLEDFGPVINEAATISKEAVAALTPAPIDVEALYRGADNEDEAMCQVTSIYNDGWNAAIDHLAAQGHLQTPVPEAERLKDALRDVLKAIVSDRHAVQDTIWVNGSPVGDFIMCALDEEIDLDELQNAPYRCKRTGELPLTAPVTPQSEFCGLKIVCDPSVPDGMILVKDERGKTLLVAGLSANPTTLTYHYDYKDMIAVAPEPPKGETE